MDDQIDFIYGIVENILKAMNHQEDKQRKMSINTLDYFNFNLPAGSTIYTDKAYNDYSFEDLLLESSDLTLLPVRKSNFLRPLPAFVKYLQARGRKIVETSGSTLERLLPKSIHAVTSKDFELKASLFIIAFSFCCAF